LTTEHFERPDQKEREISPADEEQARHDRGPGLAGTGREASPTGEEPAAWTPAVPPAPTGRSTPGDEAGSGDGCVKGRVPPGPISRRPAGAPGEAGFPGDGGSAADGDDPPGFLELVYGVLFEPRTTMARIAARPPVPAALLIVTILSLVGATMTVLALGPILNGDYFLPGPRLFSPSPAALAMTAFFALLWGYIKWFGISAVLHLVAELLGGRGTARAVFAAVGLSGLPSLFLVPFQFMAVFFSAGSAVFEILLLLAGLCALLWSFVLVVIGVKKVHRLSAGRALLTALAPFLAVLVIGLIALVTLAFYMAASPSKIQVPGF